MKQKKKTVFSTLNFVRKRKIGSHNNTRCSSQFFSYSRNSNFVKPIILTKTLTRVGHKFFKKKPTVTVIRKFFSEGIVIHHFDALRGSLILF